MTTSTTAMNDEIRELTGDETAAVAGGLWFLPPLLLAGAGFLLAAIWDD
jgi:hypothetical protein